MLDPRQIASQVFGAIDWQTEVNCYCKCPGKALRRPQSKNKVCTDREFIEQLITSTPSSRGAIVKLAGEIGYSPATTDRYLKRLSEAKLIASGGGLYWRLEA